MHTISWNEKEQLWLVQLNFITIAMFVSKRDAEEFLDLKQNKA